MLVHFLTFPKMSQNLDGSLKILQKTFDFSLFLSFHKFSATDAEYSLAGIREYHCVYFSSSSCVGWKQWEEVSFERHKIEICHR